MSAADDLAAELAALSAEYRGKLAPRLDALDAGAARLSGGAADLAPLKDLRRELHTIAGSAKTFGLPAVTDAARAAEHYLDPYCDSDRALGANERAALGELLGALRRAAETSPA